jgi:hypothetical protein
MGFKDTKKTKVYSGLPGLKKKSNGPTIVFMRIEMYLTEFTV